MSETNKIHLDNYRFKQIIKNKVRKDLRSLVSSRDINVKRDKNGKLLSIPLPSIELPRLRFGERDAGGVSSGNGDVGDPLPGSQAQPGDGKGRVGKDPGEHGFSAEMEIDELLELLKDELKLPDLKPRQNASEIETSSKKYTSVNNVCTECLKIFKKTYKKALLRSISSGIYDPNNPIVIPRKEDKFFKYPKQIVKPEVKAVIFYLMDVSGSMTREIKECVQTICFWIDALLQRTYKNKLQVRFIVHDTRAWEVSKQEFFTISTSGGTVLSSAIELTGKIIRKEYEQNDWDIYVFQVSDGDNIIYDDNVICKNMIRELCKMIVRYSYCEMNEPNSRDTFFSTIQRYINEKVRSIQIQERNEIIDVIHEFFK